MEFLNNKGEITFALIIVLFVLGITLAISIAFIMNKEISFSNLILRANKWFSSTLSSLNYGLYKLNMVKDVVPGQEVTVPYFGKENLIPFFYWPSTITILGGETAPITYQGYFGFKDLFYPVSWVFNWMVTREKGELKNLIIKENVTGQNQISNLSGLYYYYDANTGCSILKYDLFKKAYAAIVTDIALICDGQSYTVLNDGYIETGKILGDNTSTPALEDYIVELDLQTPKYVDYVNIYTSGLTPGAYIALYYYPIATNQTPIEIASTTITNQPVTLNVRQNTQKLRLAVRPNSTNNYAILTEFYAYGY